MAPTHDSVADSPYAVVRLLVTLAIMTIGTSGMYLIAVVLPSVEAEFSVSRADTSMAYTAMVIGYGIGGIAMGWLADRYGVVWSTLIGAVGVGGGYCAAAMADGVGGFIAAHGLLLGLLGGSATFAPLVADTSRWFIKRRGIAVAVCASGNYLAGAIWPPIVQHYVYTDGWRPTYMFLGIFSFICMALLALPMRRPPPEQPPLNQSISRVASPQTPAKAALATQTHKHNSGSPRPFGMSPARAQWVLSVAGVACCVAMAMPQVHIVAYCMDLGFGPARGAEMLSLMLALGVVSRLVSGLICDRIGGLRTLALGSVLQMVALALFLPFNGLVSLYVVAGLFGLFQGGIVPAYAIIVREHFPPSEAGARVGTVMMATLMGMALGAWLPGKIYDVTGSYKWAFLVGVAWNALNLGLVLFLLWRSQGGASVRGLKLSRA